MVGKIIKFSYDNPWIVLPLVLLITVALAIPATQLRIDVSSDKFMEENTPAKAEYEEAKKIFGSDILSFVYIKDSQLFTEKKLQRMRSMFDKLANMEGVEKAESLFTINNIKGEAGIIDTNPLLDWIPSDQKELLAKQKDAIENPIIKRNQISPDGNSTVITLYLKKSKKDEDFERKIKEGIDKILAEHKGDFQELFQSGSPYVMTSMSEYIVKDQLVLVPLAVAVLLLTIMLTLRNIHGGIIPLINSIISIIWMFGVMKLLNIPINPLTSIVPAILIVIGSTEDTHIVSVFLESTEEGEAPREAVIGIGKKLGTAFLVTSITTVIGFGSIAFNEVVVLKQFGIASGAGLFLNFIITIALTPVYLRFFGKHIASKHSHAHAGNNPGGWNKITDRIIKLTMDLITNRKRLVIIITAVVVIVPALLALRIGVNNDMISYFKSHSPIVRAANTMHEKLSGQNVFYIVLYKDTDDFKRSKNLKSVEAIEAYLRDLKVFDSVLSLPDYISLVNKGMNHGDPSYHKVPDSNDLIAQYLLLFQRSDIERYISPDYSKINIMVRHNVNSSNRFNAIVDKIKHDLNSGKFGNFNRVVITSEGVLIAQAAESFISGQASSLLSTAVIAAAIMAFMFISWKAGFIVLAPNVIPVIIFFGLMGIANIPLNAGTAMVAAITIGIAVDDTTIFMIVYNRNLKQYGDEKMAIKETLRTEIRPIFVSAFALAAGFLVIGFSNFVPIAQFGLLSAFVMIIAIVIELAVAPLLLSSIRLITVWDAIGLELRERLIKKATLLEGLGKWQTRRLILMSHLIEAKTGEQIIREGDVGDKMYMVLDGELSVSRTISGEKTVIDKLEAGDVFGEIALISAQKRTADVFATTDVKLLTLDWKSLERFRRLSPFISAKLFLNISKILGRRLVKTTDKMVGQL
jgi:predicted RND superfamily exporter protein